MGETVKIVAISTKHAGAAVWLCGSDAGAAGWWQLAGDAPLGPFYPL